MTVKFGGQLFGHSGVLGQRAAARFEIDELGSQLGNAGKLLPLLLVPTDDALFVFIMADQGWHDLYVLPVGLF